MARHFDVIVIGAGVVGAAASYYLSRDGRSVAVFERGAVNREGSGSTAGNLHIQAIHPRRPDQVVPVDIERFLPLQRAASDLWDTLEEDLGEELEMTRNGGLVVAETPAQVSELEAKHRAELRVGIDTQVLSGDEARRILPVLSTQVLAADWCDKDGYANPLLVTLAYLRRAQAAGVTVRPFAAVSAVDCVRDGYVVSVGSESWHATCIVNAAGPWMSQVARLTGLGLGTGAVAIQMNITRRAPRRMLFLVQHVGHALSVKQLQAGHVMIGGGWPAQELRLDGRSLPSIENSAVNIAQAIRVLPWIGDLQLLRTWAGPLATTRDEMPIVGEVRGYRNYFVAGGTYAFTFAPLWGKCIADLVAERPTMVDLSGFEPDRLRDSESGVAPAT